MKWGTKKNPYKKDWSTNYKLFTLWCNGETGNALIDSNMNEVNKTGFMSNRGRQIVASYLTRDLNIDWRLGALYFESVLTDYDPCQNWGNWNYAAGVGSDPQEDRYFSIPKQVEKYDSNLEYIRHWNLKYKSKSDKLIKNSLLIGTKKRPIIIKNDIAIITHTSTSMHIHT